MQLMPLRAPSPAAPDVAPLFTPRLVLRPASVRDRRALAPLWPEAQTRRWLIESADGTQVLGFAALRRRPDGSLEPWIALLPPHRGCGHAQEALRTLMWHAQRDSRGRRFVAVCDVPDAAADRLLRRVGFTPGYEADGVPHRWREYTLPLAA